MTTSDRLLSVLDLFELECPEWSVEEAAAALNLATSTTYRYFRSLTDKGLLASFAGGRYVLGPTIVRYDRLLRLTDPLISAAQSEMDRIAQIEPDHTVVFLCRLIGRSVMCVAQASSGDPSFAVGYERGRLMPLFRGSASKVILAMLPHRQLKALYTRESASFSAAGIGHSWPEARGMLRDIRSSSLFVSTGEIDPGMRGVSVPLVLGAGSLLASINVAGPAQMLDPDLVSRLGVALISGASRICEKIRGSSV
jgi:DNA-binding IclR family transcriptional regulator